MIRTGRLNSLSLGIIAVRDLTMGNKSSFKREKAGRALGVAPNLLIQQRHKLTPDVRVSEEPPDLPPIHSTAPIRKIRCKSQANSGLYASEAGRVHPVIVGWSTRNGPHLPRPINDTP
jgi:hypothetical protein